VAEPRDARYPVSLTTGRQRDQWHGMSRTGTLGRLFGQPAEPAIELHPQDLARRGWQPGELLRVMSRRGEMVLPVRPNDGVAPAQAFIAVHWGEEFVSGRARDGSTLTGVNALSLPACCPTSKQPELKHAAIRLEAAALPWQLLAGAWLPAELLLQRRAALMTLLQGCGYFSVLPCGREPDGRVGVLLRAADPAPMAPQRLQALASLLELQGTQVLRYADPRRGQHRAMRLAEDGEQAPLQGFVLATPGPRAAWAAGCWPPARSRPLPSRRAACRCAAAWMSTRCRFAARWPHCKARPRRACRNCSSGCNAARSAVRACPRCA
jgi:assimilatory nitrate reductase catalytic subunit